LSLDAVVAHAQARGVRFALELHNALTTHAQYLTKLLERFGPADLGVNFDTGNCFLAGHDPVAYLGLIADRVVHVHIKDIPRSLLPQRGKITGTRVGVAAGDGVIDVQAIVSLLAQVGYRGALSVECDTLEQARQSRPYLETLMQKQIRTSRARGGARFASP
jgi:sugar phosphate isomerase/epimerase